MHGFEISIRKFVMPVFILAVFIIYRQKPLAVLGETILVDKFFLHLSRGMVVAPRLPLVVKKNLPSSISRLACSYARPLSFTVMPSVSSLGRDRETVTGQCTRSIDTALERMPTAR